MSEQPYVVQAARDEHDHEQVPTKKVLLYGWNSDTLEKTRVGINADGSLKSALPTSDGNNPSTELIYTGSDITAIRKTIGSDTYEKTFTYTGSDLTGISEWVKL